MPREYVIREGSQFSLVSQAFRDGDQIPVKYTCDGNDVSPPLSWSGAPSGTMSYALIMYDPDAPAGTFIHWVLYDIPASITSLPEGVSKVESVSGVGRQGVNDFGNVGYGGPCPPRGHGTHRYYLALHALSVESLKVRTRPRAQDLLEAMRGKVLGHALLMGTYRRNRF